MNGNALCSTHDVALPRARQRLQDRRQLRQCLRAAVAAARNRFATGQGVSRHEAESRALRACHGKVKVWA
jgi:hypothetical protein